jgi:hypothetical protein
MFPPATKTILLAAILLDVNGLEIFVEISRPALFLQLYKDTLCPVLQESSCCLQI